MTPETLIRRLDDLYDPSERTVKLAVLCACMSILLTPGISKSAATHLLEDAGGHEKMTAKRGTAASFAELVWREVQAARVADRAGPPVKMEAGRMEETVVAGFNVLHI